MVFLSDSTPERVKIGDFRSRRLEDPEPFPVFV
jgi:hypothetical protein